MSVCFWLVDIVEAPGPRQAHVDALLRLYDHLKEDLELKPWPPADYGQNPSRQEWPNKKGIVHYYKIWWSKIYRAAREADFRDSWQPVRSYIVAPVRCGALVQFAHGALGSVRRNTRGPQATQQWRRSQQFRLQCVRVACLLRDFLGGDCRAPEASPRGPASAFTVPPRTASPPRCASRKCASSSLRCTCAASPFCASSTGSPPLRASIGTSPNPSSTKLTCFSWRPLSGRAWPPLRHLAPLPGTLRHPLW